MLHNDQPRFQLDVEREQRTGVAEAVFCLNKHVDQITEILEHAESINHRLLLTRLSEEKFKRLTPSWQQSLFFDAAAQVGILGEYPKPNDDSGIAIVSGGSSDYGVCREVELTLAFHGVGSRAYYDVGVAGLWRLERCLPALRECKVLVAVAGMEAALPTLVAGLVPGLVIAVPTSTGYGVSEQGKAALNACLASCAAGIVTVNIDNGFGAACAALKIVKATRTLTPDIG
ncbi:MAG: nickel pincer cofactor biosynthesis protein LarB [Halopseudomonas sp.]